MIKYTENVTKLMANMGGKYRGGLGVNSQIAHGVLNMSKVMGNRGGGEYRG